MPNLNEVDPLDAAIDGIDQAAPRPGVSKDASVDPLDAAIDGVEQGNARLRQSFYGAVRQNPDEFARARVLSRETGLPTALVARNLPRVEQRTALDRVEQLRLDAPDLARRFEDQDFASLAHDDVDTLSKVERVLKPAERAFFADPMNTSMRRRAPAELLTGPTPTLTAPTQPEGNFVNALRGMGVNTGVGLDKARINAQAWMGDILDIVARRPQTAEGDSLNQNRMREYGQANDRAEAARPEYNLGFTNDLYDATTSLAQTAPSMGLAIATKNPALGLGVAGLQSADYLKYKGRGATVGEASLGALGEGAVEVLTEALPMGFLVDKFGKAGVKDFLSGFLIREGLGEQAATLAQDAIDTAIANPNKTWGEYWAERPEAAYKTALATLMTGGAVAAPKALADVMAGAPNVRETLDERVATRTERATASADAGGAMRELATLAGDSKLRRRDAEAFAQHVQQAVDAGGRVPSSIFIDGATLANAFAQSGENVDALKASMPSLAQLDTALATQGQVEIPVGEFTAHLAGKTYADTLLQNLRTDPEAPTLAEANAYLQGEDAPRLNEEIERLAGERLAELPQALEESGIRATIAAQLDQAGRFSPDVNRSYSELHAAFFSTMAERVGTTPGQLFQNYQATIAGEALPGAPGFDQPPAGIVDRVMRWLKPDAPAYAQGNRGAFVPKEHTVDGKPLIALLKNADMSTFLHESGHYFLENYADMAKAAPALQKDMQTLYDWFGVTAEQWQDMSLDQRRQHHEKFARGFEAYLYEGAAPSIELQGLFARFRSWLLRVYSSLRGELTPDVRGVLDRMLAAESQIRLAEQARSLRPLFRTAEEAQRFGVEFSEYQGMADQAKADALSTLEVRSLRNMRWLANAKKAAAAGIKTEATEIRNRIEAEVRAEVEAEPAYRAQRFLKRGEMTTPDGEEIKAEAGHRLSIADLRAMYPEGELGAVAWQKLGYGKYGMLGEEGMHPDASAEMFGFTSGDQLVRTLLDTPPIEQAIEGRTDQRMIEEHGEMVDGDTIERTAEAAIHNEARQRMVAAELAALQNANRGQAHALAQAAKDMARRVVGQVKVGKLRPRMFTVAGAKAARAAEDALRGGDIQQSIAQKRTQLLNNALARQAYAAREEIAKAEALFREVASAGDERIGKTHNLDLVNAARAILAEYGAVPGGKVEKVGRYMEALKAYDPELYAVLEPQLTAAVADARPIGELTVDQFRALADQVESLWYMSRRSKEVEIDGRLMDRDEIAAALTARLNELGVPPTAPGEDRAITEGEKRVRYMQGARAALRRVEHWVDRMDGGKISGAFRTYLWNPISESADRYRADSAKYLARYRDLLKAVEPSLTPGKIDAPELGYTFGHAQGGMGKVELLHAILHTGNESNLRKLLLGRGWGTERADGTVDTSRWEAFIRRLANEGKLTKADFDFAQGVWDLLAEIKPLAQKTHREVFGRYFDEVTANAVATPFGTYRGGYVPALVDTFTTQDAAVYAELDAINQGNAYMFPATQRGFTKGRVEYNRPLLLDLRTVGQHIDKVLLFAHLEGRVRDTMRTLRAKGFAGTMGRYDPVAYTDMLLPWLNRAARQTVETPTTGWAGKLSDRFFRTLRQRAGMAAMFANMTNALQQITGLSITALKVKPSNLAAATVRYMRSPAQMAEEIAALSPFMAQRQHNETMAMRLDIEQLLVNPSKYEKAQAWTQRHAYFLQSATQNVVDTITWSAAYDQALAGGESDVDAIRSANSVVRETQGSLAPEDLSRWETGPAFVRMFTQFQGYFNNQANILGTEFAKVAQDMGLRQGAGRLFYIYVLGFMVPAVMAEAIVQGMRGGLDDGDDDEYLGEYLAAFFGSQFRTVAAMVPVVGQVSVVAANSFNRKPYDDRMSTAPAVSMIESAASAPHSVYKALAEDGNAKRAVRDTLTLVSIATGIPVAALAKPLGYTADVMQGNVEPSGPVDAVRGALSGAASPGTRQ